VVKLWKRKLEIEENKEAMIDLAESINSDPSNWEANARSVTKLGSLAQDLGIAETREYKEFDKVAQQLVAFATNWISNLTTSKREEFKEGLSKLTKKEQHSSSEKSGKIELSIKSLIAQVPVGAGSVNRELRGETKMSKDTNSQLSEQTQTEASAAYSKSVNNLSEERANQFGELFATAQTRFRLLRLMLLQ
jgi:hypothetical protein